MKLRKTIEDYLKTIYVIYQRKGSVCGADIAAELNVSRPTVSIAVKGLVNEKYVYMNDQHEIYLTDKGRSIAREIFDRCQTFRGLLISLGVDEKTASEDACQMEHAVSHESYEALKTMIEQQSNKV